MESFGIYGKGKSLRSLIFPALSIKLSEITISQFGLGFAMSHLALGFDFAMSYEPSAMS